MRLKVDLLPRGPYEDVVIVVDVLRATTTAAILFENGVKRLYLTGSVRAARSFAGEGEHVLIGERDGVPLEGFNYGVSPSVLREVDLAGRSVVMTTVNGPKAVAAASTAPHVLLGSLYNARSVAAVAAGLAADEVAIACAGFEDGESLEDTLTAGLLARRFQREYAHRSGGKPEDVQLREAGRLATKLLRAFPDPQEAFVQSAAGLLLRRQGLEEDIALSSLISQTEKVPVLREVIDWKPAPVFAFEAVVPNGIPA